MARKDAMLRLHAKLVARRDALRKALSGDLDALQRLNLADQVGDNVDAAMDTASDEINSQIVEIEGRELEQIEHALDRIKRGVYGRCEFCGGKISEPRINALPYTNSCIDCQRENERLGINHRYGHPGVDASRWASVYERGYSESETDSEINLSDYEVDVTESGR